MVLRFLNVLILLARYFTAVLLAFSIAVIVFVLVVVVPVMLLSSTKHVDVIAPYFADAGLVLMGFAGVAAGVTCLEKSSRRFGSIFLLAVGLAHYWYWMTFMQYREGENKEHPYFWLVGMALLTLGGLGAVFLNFRRSRKSVSPAL